MKVHGVVWLLVDVVRRIKLLLFRFPSVSLPRHPPSFYLSTVSFHRRKDEKGFLALCEKRRDIGEIESTTTTVTAMFGGRRGSLAREH